MQQSKVGAYLPDKFGGFLLGSVQVSIGSTGDAANFSLPFGQYTIRKIRLRSPSASVTGAALGIWTAASQGGTNIVANASLTNLSANLTYQESTLTSAANSTIFTNSTTLFVNVGTASSGNTIFIDIYGDAVPNQL